MSKTFIFWQGDPGWFKEEKPTRKKWVRCMTDMLLEMCLYFSHVSHYNLTTFESNTIEKVHRSSASNLENHCRNLHGYISHILHISQLQLWSTLVKCLLLKSTALALNGSYIEKLWDCLLYIDDDMERRRKEINCVCMQACEACNERPPICFGTWDAPRVTKISLFTLISKQ